MFDLCFGSAETQKGCFGRTQTWTLVQSSLNLVNLNLVKNLDLVKISVLTDFLLHKIIRFSKFLKICRKSLDLVKKRGL